MEMKVKGGQKVPTGNRREQKIVKEYCNNKKRKGKLQREMTPLT